MSAESVALAELDIAAVAIFDDEDPDEKAGEIAEDAWRGFVGALETGDKSLDPSVADRLRGTAPALRPEALRSLRSDYPEQVATMEQGPLGRADLAAWVRWFEGNKVKVDLFKTWNSFESKAGEEEQLVSQLLSRYGLVLLDYKFGADQHGEISTEIGRNVAECARAAATASTGSVPILARLTTENVDQTEAAAVEFAKGIVYPRSAYLKFLKSQIRSPNFTRVALRALAQARPGTKLFMLTTILQQALNRAVEGETSRLYELDAPGIRFLNERALEPSGMSQAEHWVDVAAGLITTSVRGDTDVATSARRMLEAMPESIPPGLSWTPLALSKIENRLRFDYAVNRLYRPIDSGDIFAFDDLDDRVAMLVTQSCDLAVRTPTPRTGDTEPSAGIPERQRATLLLGTLGENIATQDQNEERVTDFRAPLDEDGAGNEEPAKVSADAFRSIVWQFDSAVMVPRAVLDLVSLRDDGRAVAQRLASDNNYWTPAFTRYLRAVADDAVNRSAELADGGAATIRFLGTSPKQPALGSYIELSTRPLQDSVGPYLGIRRLARLRSLETQRVIDRLNFVAGRLALPSTMPFYKAEDVGLLLRPSSAVGRSDMKATSVVFFRDKDKERKALRVDTAEFKTRCSNVSEFGALEERVASLPPTFDLMGLLSEEDLRTRFELRFADGSYKLSDLRPTDTPPIVVRKAGGDPAGAGRKRTEGRSPRGGRSCT